MEHPYILTMKETCNANGTVTLSYQASNQERFEFSEIIQDSTGIFDITDIRDSSGRHYTNASASNPIDSTFIQDTDNEYNSISVLPIPLVLDKGKTLYFDVKDTSTSSNVITIKLIGKLIIE